MNSKEKERYQKLLLAKKIETHERLSEIYSESMEVESGDVQDVGDKAESSYTKEFLLSLTDSDRNEVMMIDEALKRVDKCTYGQCQMCGQPIAKKRLDAIPWAPYCIECQEKSEEGTA